MTFKPQSIHISMKKRFALVVAVLAVFSILVFSLIICAGLVEAANLIVYNNSPTQMYYLKIGGSQ